MRYFISLWPLSFLSGIWKKLAWGWVPILTCAYGSFILFNFCIESYSAITHRVIEFWYGLAHIDFNTLKFSYCPIFSNNTPCALFTWHQKLYLWVCLYIRGAFHDNFPWFLAFIFCRKRARTETQQGTEKASKRNRRTVFQRVSTGSGVINFLFYHLSSLFTWPSS